MEGRYLSQVGQSAELVYTCSRMPAQLGGLCWRTYGVMQPEAPVAEPGLMYSLPPSTLALNACVCPLTRMSTSICRRRIASASASPHGTIWCPWMSPMRKAPTVITLLSGRFAFCAAEDARWSSAMPSVCVLRSDALQVAGTPRQSRHARHAGRSRGHAGSPAPPLSTYFLCRGCAGFYSEPAWRCARAELPSQVKLVAASCSQHASRAPLPAAS